MERKESVIHSVHITKIELHRGKEPECFYACNVPIYQKQGVYDMKIYQDPGIQTIYRKE